MKLDRQAPSITHTRQSGKLRKPYWSWKTARSFGAGASAPSAKPWGKLCFKHLD